MVTHLVDLAAELQYMIFENLQSDTDLYQKDLRNLCKTCKFYHHAVLPYILSTIVLHNDEDSASTARAVTGRYKEYVKRLYFRRRHIGGNMSDWRDHEYNLPDSVISMLSNLSHFPNLNRIVLDWQLDWDMGILDNPLGYPHPTPQDFNRSVSKEKYPCFHFMMRVFNAISNNANSGIVIKSLEIKDLPVSPIESFSSDDFKKLLRNIETFKLGLMFDLEDWSAKRVYGGLCRSLNEAFFGHLGSITELSVTSPSYGPWGLHSSHNDARLCLRPVHLPLLERLTLERCFISRRLVKFLVARADTLKSVVLDDCFASSPTIRVEITAWNPIHWSELFESFAQADPKRLREFLVLPFDRVLDEDNDEDSDEDAEYRALKEFYPGRRFFKYGYLPDPLDTEMYDEPFVMNERFADGEDQRAYDSLMEIVARNRRQVSVAYPQLAPAIPE